MTGFEEINSKLAVYKRDRYKRLLPHGIQRAGIVAERQTLGQNIIVIIVKRLCS